MFFMMMTLCFCSLPPSEVATLNAIRPWNSSICLCCPTFPYPDCPQIPLVADAQEDWKALPGKPQANSAGLLRKSSRPDRGHVLLDLGLIVLCSGCLANSLNLLFLQFFFFFLGGGGGFLFGRSMEGGPDFFLAIGEAFRAKKVAQGASQNRQPAYALYCIAEARQILDPYVLCVSCRLCPGSTSQTRTRWLGGLHGLGGLFYLLCSPPLMLLVGDHRQD